MTTQELSGPILKLLALASPGSAGEHPPGAGDPQPLPLEPPGRKPGRETRQTIRKPRRASRDGGRSQAQLEADALDALFGGGKMDPQSALGILGYKPVPERTPKRHISKWLLDRRLQEKLPGAMPDWRRRINAPTRGLEALRKFQHECCAICGTHHIAAQGLRRDLMPDGEVRGLLCRPCLQNLAQPSRRRSRSWRAKRLAYLQDPPAPRFAGVARGPALAQTPPASTPRVRALKLSARQSQALYDLCNPHGRGWKNGSRTWGYRIPLTFRQLSALGFAEIEAWPEGGGVVTATEAGEAMAKILVQIKRPRSRKPVPQYGAAAGKP
ncbi:MAG: hypothetical protein KGL39_03500 [Patescibacteria group bacterium]|nr:hypothetical protein [Patescibacteria group bacterium]